MKKIKVLVVDDSCLYQRLLSDVVKQHEQMMVVGTAANGKLALEMAESLKPDLVTLDILMPELDGIQTLIELRKRWPEIRTIMLSTLTSAGSDAALDALALGASDYVAKPSNKHGVKNIQTELAKDLIPKIEALCGVENCFSDINQPEHTKQHGTRSVSSRPGAKTDISLLAIGISTGGPDALSRLFSELPGNLRVPVVVVQHMPPVFTSKLAARLDSSSELRVREAKLGDRLKAGTVYIAPGNYHMILDRIGNETLINLNQESAENSCRPSVDPLFRSIAAIYGSRCLGVIMTGMGKDGLKGSEALVNAGSRVIVQDKYTSIVWGMPKFVAQAGLAEEEVPLDRLAAAILSRLGNVSDGIIQTGIVGTTDEAVNSPVNPQRKSSGGAHE